MNIYVLNLHNAGRLRPEQRAYLLAHNPEVLVLTECRSGSAALHQELREAGWPNLQAPPVPDVRSVLIASRLPIAPAPEIAIPAMAADIAPLWMRRWVAIRLSLPMDPHELLLVAVYGPLDNRPVRVVARFWDAAVSALVPVSGRAALLLGDLNLVDRADSALLEHTPRYSPLWQSGWRDAWRSRNPGSHEPSWYNGPTGNGFRLDHVWCTAKLLRSIGAVGYDHDTRLRLGVAKGGLGSGRAVSDHSALRVELLPARARFALPWRRNAEKIPSCAPTPASSVE